MYPPREDDPDEDYAAWMAWLEDERVHTDPGEVTRRVSSSEGVEYEIGGDPVMWPATPSKPPKAKP